MKPVRTIIVLIALAMLGSGACPSSNKDIGDNPPADRGGDSGNAGNGSDAKDMADPRKVLAESFPECMDEPMIGASSGARCEFDREKNEHRITFWHGWGDCPAGCINEVIDARYIIDKKGRIFSAGDNWEPGNQVPPGTVIRSDQFPRSKGPSDGLDPGPSPNPAPMLYDPPKDGGAKSGADKKSAAKDEQRETIWIGRSMTVGQCMDRETILAMVGGGNADASGLLGPGGKAAAPTILKTALDPGAEPSKSFARWIAKVEKEAYESDRENFMCEACHVCSDLVRVYREVYRDEYESRPELFAGWRALAD